MGVIGSTSSRSALYSEKSRLTAVWGYLTAEVSNVARYDKVGKEIISIVCLLQIWQVRIT